MKDFCAGFHLWVFGMDFFSALSGGSASDGTSEEREDTWKQREERVGKEATTNDNSF